MPNPLEALQKAQGIESADPSLARKILEWATGYPSTPTTDVGPVDLLSAATPLLFHGTSKAFARFDPTQGNRADTLGGLIHFTEDPVRAAQFAPSVPPLWAHDDLLGDNVIAATGPSITRVLSLNQPTPDDYLRIAAATTGPARKAIKEDWKMWKEQIKAASLLRALQEDPSLLRKAGYEAVRYDDLGHPSWAFPDASQLQTPWGVPLGK